MDKLKKIIKYNKQMMTIATIIVIIGIISGSIFTVILSTNDKKVVIESMNSFTNNITHNSYNYIDSLKNILLANTLLSIVIWILGISIIGIILVIIILFYKSFTLGFTIGSFILAYNFKGLIIALVYIFPSLIINILILMYLSTYSIQLSSVLIKSIIHKRTLNFKSFMNNYIKVLIVSLVFIISSSLFETFFSTYILKYVISIIL